MSKTNEILCRCPKVDEFFCCQSDCENLLKECNAESCEYGQIIKYTCNDCDDKDNCEYAFDDYCTDGDCLVIK